jgi:hypothetical protein
LERVTRRKRLALSSTFVASVVAVLAAGCGCPHTGAHVSRAISANLVLEDYVRLQTLTPGSWTNDGNVYPETIGLVWFNDDTTTNGISPVQHNDLQLLFYDTAHGTTDPSLGPGTEAVGFELLVHDFPGTPTEIPLDDARAQLSAGFGHDGLGAGGVVQHGLSGHLSLTTFSTGPCPNAYACLLTAQGTFSFTATGADGQRTTVTNGTIAASYSTFRDNTCYQQND